MQSPDLNLNLIEHAFHFLKAKLKAERPTNKPQVKIAEVKAWQSITKQETQSLVMSMSSDLMQSLSAKIDSQQNIKNKHFIYDYISLSNYI